MRKNKNVARKLLLNWVSVGRRKHNTIALLNYLPMAIMESYDDSEIVEEYIKEYVGGDVKALVSGLDEILYDTNNVINGWTVLLTKYSLVIHVPVSRFGFIKSKKFISVLCL